MRRKSMASVVLVAGALACSGDSVESPAEPVFAVVPVFAREASHFSTHASGDEEVPPTGSLAQGQAILRLSDDGTELSFKLIVANIENVLQAHIHLAPEGQNGAIVAFLYGPVAPAGRSQGVLSEGVITAASLTGPLAGQPLSALIEAIRAGDAYVNVHTSQFPGGEIRGQLP